MYSGLPSHLFSHDSIVANVSVYAISLQRNERSHLNVDLKMFSKNSRRSRRFFLRDAISDQFDIVNGNIAHITRTSHPFDDYLRKNELIRVLARCYKRDYLEFLIYGAQNVETAIPSVPLVPRLRKKRLLRVQVPRIVRLLHINP